MYTAVVTFSSRFPYRVVAPNGAVVLKSNDWGSVKDHADLLNQTNLDLNEVLYPKGGHDA